jgi:hypothetical protein
MQTADTLPVDDTTVVLDVPVQRGQTLIEQVIVRKPNAGELRGIQLAELLQLDVTSLIKVIPRLTSLTAVEVGTLDPADLLAIGTQVVGFLLQKQVKTAASLAA